VADEAGTTNNYATTLTAKRLDGTMCLETGRHLWDLAELVGLGSPASDAAPCRAVTNFIAIDA